MKNPTQHLQIQNCLLHPHRQRRARRLVLVLAALILIVLTTAACIPSRIGVSWAGLKIIGEDQHILVVYNELVTLVDPQNGQEVALLNEEGNPRRDENGNIRRWKITPPQGAQFFGAPLQLDDRTLLIADYVNKNLALIDLPTARLEPVTTPISGQTVANLTTDGSRIFIPYYNYNLAAYDLETRELDWLFETSNGIWSPPLLHEGVLYFGAMNHQFYAIDAATGEKRWEVDLAGAVAASPTLHNNRLYVGSFDRKLFEISLDGDITNTYVTENWVWSAPVIVGDVLYTADMGGYVYALQLGAEGGFSELWKTKATGRGIRPAPLVTDEFVIVAAREGQLDWLDVEDGSIVFTREVQAEVLSDILLIQPSETLEIAEPRIIISTTDRSRMLMAFTLNNGDNLWKYPN